MLIEAISNPLTYRWPGGEIRLEPGKPVELSDERAKRLLEKVPHKVRLVESDAGPVPMHDPRFLDAYRALSAWLASLTPPLTEAHPAWPEAWAAFQRIDNAWCRGDLAAFRTAIEMIRDAARTRT